MDQFSKLFFAITADVSIRMPRVIINNKLRSGTFLKFQTHPPFRHFFITRVLIASSANIEIQNDPDDCDDPDDPDKCSILEKSIFIYFWNVNCFHLSHFKENVKNMHVPTFIILRIVNTWIFCEIVWKHFKNLNINL